MKFHHFGLASGALLLIAAQDPPAPPPKGATFSEAFSEQSNAAKAVQAADELKDSAADAGPAPSEAAEVPPAPAEADAVPTASEAVPADTGTTKPAPVRAAVPAKGEAPTREFMVGVWAEPGKSCAAAMDFKADGTLIGPFPRWELNDGVLTMTGNRQKIWLTVIDKDTMQSRRSDSDPPRTLKRCP